MISQGAENAVVEWYEEDRHGRNVYRRSIVPLDEVTYEERQAHVTNPQEGAPYGIPFADIFVPTHLGPLVERELHRVGIWTLEDLRGNPQGARGALLAAYQMDYTRLLRESAAYVAD